MMLKKWGWLVVIMLVIKNLASVTSLARLRPSTHSIQWNGNHKLCREPFSTKSALWRLPKPIAGLSVLQHSCMASPSLWNRDRWQCHALSGRLSCQGHIRTYTLQSSFLASCNPEKEPAHESIFSIHNVKRVTRSSRHLVCEAPLFSLPKSVKSAPCICKQCSTL